jgi:hypothetical protein
LAMLPPFSPRCWPCKFLSPPLSAYAVAGGRRQGVFG